MADDAATPHTAEELAALRELGVTLPQDLSEARAEDEANEQWMAAQTAQANADARIEDDKIAKLVSGAFAPDGQWRVRPGTEGQETSPAVDPTEAENRREDAQAALDGLATRLLEWLLEQPELALTSGVDDLGDGIYGFTIIDGRTQAGVSMTLNLTP